MPCPPPDFVRSVDPISTGGGADYAHHIITCPLKIFRPAALPVRQLRYGLGSCSLGPNFLQNESSQSSQIYLSPEKLR